MHVIDFLQPEDFYRDVHQVQDAAILTLYRQHTPADFITLCDCLERRKQLENVGGASYVTSLIHGVPTSLNIEYSN